MDLIEKLREQIEFEYHDALTALETLEKYLTKQNQPNTGVPKQPKRPRRVAYKKIHGQESMRQRVLREVQDKWMTVAEVAAITGLERPQVRGVLQAIDVRPSVQKRVNHNGVKEFLYSPPQVPTQESAQEDVNGELAESLA